jgi:hypothetical protein
MGRDCCEWKWALRMETYKNGIWHGVVVRRVHSCMHGFPPKGNSLINLGCGAGRFICNIVIVTNVRFGSGVCILFFSVRSTHVIYYTSLLLFHKPSMVRPWCVFFENVPAVILCLICFRRSRRVRCYKVHVLLRHVAGGALQTLKRLLYEQFGDDF